MKIWRITNEQATAHALACGIDLKGREALALQNAQGRTLAVDILHPETQTVFLEAGTYMDRAEVLLSRSIGVDYCVVEEHALKHDTSPFAPYTFTLDIVRKVPMGNCHIIQFAGNMVCVCHGEKQAYSIIDALCQSWDCQPSGFTVTLDYIPNLPF